ncbi:MAG TPA: VOC family protein [Acidimicrobiia bacterium]|nr:VOC family protein [Acidimicrobiia bacterium]
MALADGRLFHVNVNCADLERSRRFYANGLGLREGVRTAASHAQSGVAFGLDRARWDAWILLGPNGFDGSAIDLLEWQEPAPVRAAPARLECCGFQRLGLIVRDLDATLERVDDLGGAVWSDPFTHAIPGGSEIRLVMANDPDGTPLELIEGDSPRVAFVAVACADLDRSVDFYRSLGFREAARFPSTSDHGDHLRIDGPVAMEEVMMRAPTKSEMTVMLVGFTSPLPVHEAPRPANSIGMWRTALLVADLDAAYAELGRLGITTLSPPVAMEMGPGLPELRFVCFAGLDGETLELIEQPAR